MIRSFRHKGLERFYRTGSKAGIQARHADKLHRLLTLLDVAEGPEDMVLPAYRLHSLSGDLSGFWSARIDGNWRVIFRFVGNGDVELVDYLDYH